MNQNTNVTTATAVFNIGQTNVKLTLLDDDGAVLAERRGPNGIVAGGEVTSLGCHTDLREPLRRRPSTLVAQMGWQDKFPPLRPAWSVRSAPCAGT
ncbi:hypothetical protein ACFDR9_001459 [Janthinobacterium sp. CG_23.3]|uniref:hypothetical protein n=1 Tax=Janthinobacterium sp. CG_23.3 TaxID=3349634 RepID=UPI0038D39926